MPIGVSLISVAFWVWLAAIIISQDIAKTKRRRADLDLIRFAIEKGQPLTPELIEKILGNQARRLFIAGVITVAAGLGLIVFALFLSRISPHGGWIITGAGGIVICVGAGMIVSDLLMRRDAQPAA